MVPAPYASACVAIAGEDATKARLVRDGAESLGGEFFLAEDWLLHHIWAAGAGAAKAAQDSMSTSNPAEFQSLTVEGSPALSRDAVAAALRSG